MDRPLPRERKVHKASSPDENSGLTDLGGDPITLRASISILSVLRLVNDSELEDAGGSIGVGGVRRLAGKKMQTVAEEKRREKSRSGREACRRKRKVFIREERRSAETSESQQDLFKTA